MHQTIFLAGAAGAIGRRLAPILVADGWRVVGTTRSAARALLLSDLGVEPVVVDVYDAAALRTAVVACRPEVVIHQLTDLPYALATDDLPAALARNARLRDEGTRNLVAAAVAAGARRLVAQSIAFLYAEGLTPHREGDTLLPETDPRYGETVRGVASLERQVLEAPLIGLVLRYGFFYGPGTGADVPSGPGSVHVDAAARAAALAAVQGPAGVYNVAEPNGPIDVNKAVRKLGWSPGWRPATPARPTGAAQRTGHHAR